MNSYALCYSESIDCNNNASEIVLVSKNLAQLESILKRINKLGSHTRNYSIKNLVLPNSNKVFIPIVSYCDYNFSFSEYFLNFASHDLQKRSYYEHWVQKEFKIDDLDDLKIKEYQIYNSLSKDQIHEILKDCNSEYQEIEHKNLLISKGQYDFSLDY